MRPHIRSRLALWGGAVVLAAAPGLASAQDGQPSVGPPVTSTRTNDRKNNEAQPITDTLPRESTNLLTPVPATADDPAPPGTRGVRVDVPAGTPAATGVPARGAAVPGAPATGVAQPAGRAMPGVMSMEGVVTRISRPGKDFAEERIRITVDPTQTWDTYATAGPMNLPQRSTTRSASTGRTNRSSARPADYDKARTDNRASADKDRAIDNRTADEKAADEKAADEKAADDQARADNANRSQGIDMIITHRSQILTHARSPEGYDLFNVDNPSAPEVQISRTGATVRPVVPAPGPKPASFANIREGSFVHVRYRRMGDRNVVLNLNLIELPTNPSTPTAYPTGDTGGPAPGGGLTRPGGGPIGAPTVPPGTRTLPPPAGAPARPGTVPAPAPGAADAPPGTRVPTVPLTPTAPSFGPR